MVLNNEYLFSWDGIPGNDDGRLINFLKQNYGIEWVKTAKIEKIDDDKTIRVSVEKNYLSLNLDDEKNKINLKIDDGRTDEFIAKMENGKLNIYNNENTDDPQKGYIINYQNLETDVDKAIKKDSSELFKNKTPKECKYIQKVVENRLSKLEITINVIIFITTVAVSFVFPYLITKEGIEYFLVGVIIFIFAIFLGYYYWKPKYEACRRIILDVEQRLLEGSVEPKSQQETDNIISNTQQNPISIEYIKAQLDLLKMKMAGFLGGMLVLANSILQTNKIELKLILFAVLFVLMIRLITKYTDYSKKLNEI